MSSIVISGDTSGAITLAAPSVAGTNTATLPAAAGTVMVSGNMPAFRALGSGISVAGSTFTTFTAFSSPTFDTASAFNTSTGKFQPTVAGYYQINVKVDYGSNGVAAASSIDAGISKNGTTYNYSGCANTGGGSFPAVMCCDIVYLNGSTDYVQAQAYQNSSSTATGVTCSFSGVMVRSA